MTGLVGSLLALGLLICLARRGVSVLVLWPAPPRYRRCSRPDLADRSRRRCASGIGLRLVLSGDFFT